MEVENRVDSHYFFYKDTPVVQLQRDKIKTRN